MLDLSAAALASARWRISDKTTSGWFGDGPLEGATTYDAGNRSPPFSGAKDKTANLARLRRALRPGRIPSSVRRARTARKCSGLIVTATTPITWPHRRLDAGFALDGCTATWARLPVGATQKLRFGASGANRLNPVGRGSRSGSDLLTASEVRPLHGERVGGGVTVSRWSSASRFAARIDLSPPGRCRPGPRTD